MKNFLFNRLLLQDDTIQLKDLYHIKELGIGNYGKVSLVYCKKNSFFYAIKTIQKKQILYEKLNHNLELEKNILLSIDNPFIVKLVKCLKDNKNIYLLMEYLKGKELFYVIRDIGLLNTQQALFYTANMLLAINYLHKRKFIYRDLKPENLIVLNNGYLKLIDFGTVKNITDRTSTIIGTPQYMAPEVIFGEGYSFQVDFWSIAICAYEFICGGVPFGENFEDPMKIYYSIINDELTFPNFCNDKEFIVLMKQMFIQINDIVIDKEKEEIYLNNKNTHNCLIDKFCDYVNKNYQEYKPDDGIKISDDEINEFNKWYENF